MLWRSWVSSRAAVYVCACGHTRKYLRRKPIWVLSLSFFLFFLKMKLLKYSKVILWLPMLVFGGRVVLTVIGSCAVDHVLASTVPMWSFLVTCLVWLLAIHLLNLELKRSGTVTLPANRPCICSPQSRRQCNIIPEWLSPHYMRIGCWGCSIHIGWT